MIDYYEFLQISPHAETDTVHRVYRFLAARLHPDNPESGDADMFHMLKTAYDVLSDSERRREYDLSRQRQPHDDAPLSDSVDFMDSLDGELNRRLAVLAVLYSKRRTSPNKPEVPLAEIEVRMGFPRDYLDFTTWYLMKKGYIARADNSDFTLTAEGVDFVETQRGNIPTLNKMLTNGSTSSSPDLGRTNKQASPAGRPTQSASASGPIILPSEMGRPHAEYALAAPAVDRRIVSGTAATTIAGERRTNGTERRKSSRGRRATD